MKIATALPQEPDLRMGSNPDDGIVRLSDPKRAERYHRQVCIRIEMTETPEQLEALWDREAPMFRALDDLWPIYGQIVRDAYETQLAVLR